MDEEETAQEREKGVSDGMYKFKYYGGGDDGGGGGWADTRRRKRMRVLERVSAR